MTPANFPSADAESIARAAAVLRSGGLVAFPTETVYGLGADAENEAAVKRVFAAKGRPLDHPLIVHLPQAELAGWARDVPASAGRLAGEFWPGPLTLILKRGPRSLLAATGGQDTVAIRVPAHPVARRLLLAFGGGLVAPSANRFGRVSTTTFADACEELQGVVDLVLDGGECPIGVESTIVDLTSDSPTIRRPGAITAEQLAKVLGSDVAFAAAVEDAGPRCSGRLTSHYAPRAAVELVRRAEIIGRAGDLQRQERRVVVVSERPPTGLAATVPHVALAGDVESFARGVYAALREADRRGADVILIEPPAEQGLGVAILDRLRKAAAPRPPAAE